MSYIEIFRDQPRYNRDTAEIDHSFINQRHYQPGNPAGNQPGKPAGNQPVITTPLLMPRLRIEIVTRSDRAASCARDGNALTAATRSQRRRAHSGNALTAATRSQRRHTCSGNEHPQSHTACTGTHRAPDKHHCARCHCHCQRKTTHMQVLKRRSCPPSLRHLWAAPAQ